MKNILTTNRQISISKIILHLFLLSVIIVICLNPSFAGNKAIHNEKDSGLFELTIDISQLKNRSGKFRITVGGNSIIPEVDNNIIKITAPLAEPRRSFVTFHPDNAISQNPNKGLNEIAAELDGFFTFLAEPGHCHIITDSIIAKSSIT